MYHSDIETMIMLVRTAHRSQSDVLVGTFSQLNLEVTNGVPLDGYTRDALDSAKAAVAELASLLPIADELPRFAIARKRHFAREAIFAFLDELRRQQSLMNN